LTEFIKFDGEDAKALAAVEAEMDALNESSEKQFNFLQDKIKEIIYKASGLTKEQGDAKDWVLVSKYYTSHGFFMAEVDENRLPDLADFMPAPTKIKPTMN